MLLNQSTVEFQICLCQLYWHIFCFHVPVSDNKINTTFMNRKQINETDDHKGYLDQGETNLLQGVRFGE